MPEAPDWAAMWAPYDECTYREALAYLCPSQTVLDIGAGDLRFARRAAALGCTVIAVERQAGVVQRGLSAGPLPDGLRVVLADARTWEFPPVDRAVLLMRHCADFALYVHKLRACGCEALITNARWGMGVECIPLGPGAPYSAHRAGWSACVRCGALTFIPGDPALVPPDVDVWVTNVEGCPCCEEP